MFRTNLRLGYAAELVDPANTSYSSRRPPRFELLKTGGYAWFVQRLPDGISVATVYQPELLALDPGMIDPERCQFVCLTPTWWLAQEQRGLWQHHDRCAAILAHARALEFLRDPDTPPDAHRTTFTADDLLDARSPGGASHGLYRKAHDSSDHQGSGLCRPALSERPAAGHPDPVTDGLSAISRRRMTGRRWLGLGAAYGHRRLSGMGHRADRPGTGRRLSGRAWRAGSLPGRPGPALPAGQPQPHRRRSQVLAQHKSIRRKERMAHPHSVAVGGYYPTPPQLIPPIAALIRVEGRDQSYPAHQRPSAVLRRSVRGRRRGGLRPGRCRVGHTPAARDGAGCRDLRRRGRAGAGTRTTQPGHGHLRLRRRQARAAWR